MNINYNIKCCSHCNSKDIVALGNEQQIYGLVSLKIHDDETTADLNSFLPVIATVCRDCGTIELIHINAKAIKNN